MRTSVRGPESPGLLRREAPRKRGPGGSKDARGTIGFSMLSAISAGAEKEAGLIIAAQKSFGQHVYKPQPRTDSGRHDASKRQAVELARHPPPGRAPGNATSTYELLQANLGLFGDVPDIESRKAAEIANDREKWRSLRPSNRCYPLHGEMQ